MKLSLVALLLGSLVAKPVLVKVNGDAYVMPKDLITADLLVNDPTYADVLASDLPEEFWRRQTRKELAQLTCKFDFGGLLGDLKKMLGNGETDRMFFSKDGDLLMVSEVTPTPNGPVFKTALDYMAEDGFHFSDVNLQVLGDYPKYVLNKLKLAPTLANLRREDIYSLTRLFFPNMEKFAARAESYVDFAKQSIGMILARLIQNEGGSLEELKADKEAMDLLSTLILYNAGSLTDFLIEFSRAMDRQTGPVLLLDFIVGKLYDFRFQQHVKEGSPEKAASFLLNAGWIEEDRVASMISGLCDQFGLGIFGPQEWKRILEHSNQFQLLDVIVGGIILGAIDSSSLKSRGLIDKYVRKEVHESLWIAQTPDALKVVSKPLSWITLNNPDIFLPTKFLRLLAGDDEASVLAKECLFKHMIFNGEKATLLPWFWSLFGAGQAKFPSFRLEFKKKAIEADPEIGYLAFPELFEGRPPLNFKKDSLIELMKFGPVDGTLRYVNGVLSKLMQLRMDVFSRDELYWVIEWARISKLSYALGNQLFVLVNKDVSALTFLKLKRTGYQDIKEMDSFPLGPDGEFTLETFRAIFTWVPYELDAEIMQKFELFATGMNDSDIAFVLRTTPYRPRVEVILRRQFANLRKAKQDLPAMDYDSIMSRVMGFEDVLRLYANDPAWLVNLARRPWDPTDIEIVRKVFLAHGFSPEVWKMIRFCPQEDVLAYLDAIQQFNNVPFAFIEHLRTERRLGPQKIWGYLKANVYNPTL